MEDHDMGVSNDQENSDHRARSLPSSSSSSAHNSSSHSSSSSSSSSFLNPEFDRHPLGTLPSNTGDRAMLPPLEEKKEILRSVIVNSSSSSSIPSGEVPPSEEKKGTGSSELDLKLDEKRRAELKTDKKDVRYQPDPHAVRTVYPIYQWQWLDVKDTQGTWLEAQVLQVTTAPPDAPDGSENKFLVHYKGWKSKYDEWLSTDPNHTDSARLAPLGRHATLPQRYGEVKTNVGVKLDILDTVDKWVPGEIIDVSHVRDTLMLQVRYVGWEPKYDEWLNYDSYRLAPFRTFTTPEKRVQHVPQGSGQPAVFSATNDNEMKFRELLAKQLKCFIVDQDPDGNCLFRSVSHQVYGDPAYHDLVRVKCMEYIASERSFYSAFIEGDFHRYVERMKLPGEWGDHVEIQAMSEMYQRPIEVYAYSATPMKTFKGSFDKRTPMRLSYHFQSHYNSIQPSNPEQFAAAFLRTHPGEHEDKIIKRAKEFRIQREETKTNANSESEQLRLALDISRAEFNNRDSGMFDAVVHESLKELQARIGTDTRLAEEASLREYEEKILIDSAKQKSEDDVLEEAKKLSLQEAKDIAVSPVVPSQGRAPHSGSGSGSGSGTTRPSSVEETQLRKAMAESLKDPKARTVVDADLKSSSDLDIALRLSRAEHDKKMARGTDLPLLIRQLLDAGFTLEQATLAYSMMHDPKISDEINYSNMVTYLFTRFDR